MRSLSASTLVLLILVWSSICSDTWATSIPGGLRLWLDGNDASTISGSPVTTWTDKSTFGNDATAAGTLRPTYSAGTGANGTGEVTFDGSNDLLNAGNAIPMSSNTSIFFVLDRPNTNGRGGIFQRQTSSPFSGYELGQGAAAAFSMGARDGADLVSFTGTAKSGLQLWQSSVDFNANPGTTTVRLFEDGGLVGSNTSTAIDSIGTGSDPLLIMNRDFGTAGNTMAGDVSEIIVYDRVVNAAERTVLQNYLSSKFDLTLASGDFYDGDTLANSHFDHDVFGIGNDQTGADPGSLTSGTSTSLGITISATNLDNGDFILAGFQDDNDFLQSTTFIDQTALDGDELVTLTYDLSILNVTGAWALGFDDDDPDSLAFLAAGTQIGDQLNFVISASQLQDGFYGLVTPPVPEPSSFTLLSLGALGLVTRRRRRRAVVQQNTSSDVSFPSVPVRSNQGVSAMTRIATLASCLLVALVSLVSVPPVARATAVADVSEIGSFQQAYQLNIPDSPNYSAGISYTLDNTGSLTLPYGFDRVGYYMELDDDDDANPREWVWVSVDAFTNDVSMIGVPNVTSGITWQQTLSNLNIESNSSGITTGTGITTGNIEFWPGNYLPAQFNGGLGASSAIYDWDDTISSTTNGHGSMQIHNYGAGETLFAFNRFHAGTGGTVGIGNQSSGNTDWTLNVNAPDFELKSLEIWVHATVPVVPEPSSFLLLGLGVLGMVRHTQRRRQTLRAGCA